MARMKILTWWLFLSLLTIVRSTFDEPIDGPTGTSFFFDFKRNHLMVYDLPSGDLQAYLYVPAYDVTYWPKEKAMLYTYGGLEIREFDIWGDYNDSLIIDKEMLGTNEYWVYVRLEVRENWILGGAIDISTSRLGLYRLKSDTKNGQYEVTLLVSESVSASKNLIIHPTLSPSTRLSGYVTFLATHPHPRHVYAVGELGIFRVSYDGGDSELVLEDEFAVNPTIIESEHLLYFVTGADRNIVRSCDLDGGNLRTLYTSSVRVGAADVYGEWLVISEENGVKEYQFINLNTNETRTILNVPHDGSDYLVGRLDFWGIREECRTYSLIRPAVITTKTHEDVTITTAISSDGNVPYQYFSSFDRLRFTGTGFDLPDTAEPRYSQLDPTTLLLPRDNENRAERQGVYLHKIVTPFGDEETIVAVLQSPGKISFEKPTLTVNIGDTVHLSVPKPHFIRLRWRHNGRMMRQWSHKGSITLHNVTTKDAGIYESHLTTLRLFGNHAIMRLIVRECPAGFCSPPNCTEKCPQCFNGGVPRHDTIHGEICICAPGFMGSRCRRATDLGTYGQNGELSCPNEDCKGILFCQVDPYGCSCVSGYMGPDCKTPCSRGFFGPNCMVECHCSDNSLCDPRTGRCRNSMCETGWRGFNCQIPVESTLRNV